LLKVEVGNDPGVFDDLRDWWNSQPGPRASPFLRTEWFQTWASTRFDENEELYVPVVMDGTDPLAAVALSRKGPRFRSLADGSSDLFDIVHDGSGTGIDLLRSHVTKLTRVTLDRVDSRSTLADIARSSTRWSVQRLIRSPWIDLSEGLDPVWRQLGSKKRATIRRADRALQSVGEVDVVEALDATNLDEVLKEAFDLEARGWKGTAQVAVNSNPGKLQFSTRFAHVALDLGWLRIHRLRVGGRLAAWEYDLEYKGQMYGILKSYDETLPNHCSPGTFLFSKALEAAVDRGVVGFALGGDDSTPWKTNWTPNTRERVDIAGFGSNLSGRAALVASKTKRKVGSTARKIGKPARSSDAGRPG
jgi:CelD/BcsL family acetyltransferase involved in cellulose biosynthesis